MFEKPTSLLVVIQIIIHVCLGLEYDNCACGRQNLAARIVGGTIVNQTHQYPWLVALTSLKGDVFCSGTILNDRYILTSGHCFDPDTNQHYGAFNILISTDGNLTSNSTRRLQPTNIRIHEGYLRSGNKLVNDIALIKLRDRIDFVQSELKPICLPPSNDDQIITDQYIVAGWGQTRERGSTSDILLQASLPFVDKHSCNNFYGDIVDDNVLCAGGTQDKDSCLGDSGGPLMSFMPNGTIYQTGIVSYGLGCGRPGYYGVYTRVSKYLDWIYKITESSENVKYCLPKIQPHDTTTSKKAGPVYPNLPNCGIPGENSTIGPRIIAGKDASPLEFPWMVALGYKKAFIGAGILIGPYYVLTNARRLAALVTYWEFSLEDLTVIMGSHDLTRHEHTKRVYDVEQIHFHPRFGLSSATSNDFAIIELKKDSVDTLYRPICLVKSVLNLRDYTTLLAAGWGSATISDTVPNPTLKKATMAFISYSTCKSYYGDLMPDSAFCAVGLKQADLCPGDGGGPVMYPFRERFYLVGVYSWSPIESCSTEQSVPVFADIRNALPWISQITGLKTI